MTSDSHKAYALADELIANKHRIHIDGDAEKLQVSVPFRGALYADTFRELMDIAERHEHTVVSDFANSSVRFIEKAST